MTTIQINVADPSAPLPSTAGASIAGGISLGHVPTESDSAPEDSQGVLTVDATRRSRGANINYSISDADGIRAVTAVIMLASDDTRSNVTSQIARSDANTFSGTSLRANNKWRVASITITYVDAASGETRTLTQSWSL